MGNLAAFRAITISLHQQAMACQDSIGFVALRAAIVQTRQAYKEISFLVEHLYPDHASYWFNGAPILRLGPDSLTERRVGVRPPEGLQVLEEQVFGAL